MDDDTAGTGIIGDIKARAAIQRIGAGPADQRVVARAAFEPFVGRGADQAVVVGTADDMFDIDDRIALGIAAAAGRAIEMDIDPCGRLAEIDRVDPGAAVDRIALAVGIERVVAAPAVKHAGAGGVAAQRVVVERRAFDLFDIGQHVALGPAARSGNAVGADRHRCVRIAVIDRVPAGAPVNRVGAEPGLEIVVADAARKTVVARAAKDRIVAAAAEDRHPAVVAVDHVGLVRSDHFLDVGQPVTCGIAAGAIAAIHPDRHARAGRIRIVDHVEPGSAVVAVGPAAGQERVVARAAVEAFVGGRALHRVVEGRSDDDLDVGHRVAFGIAARRDPGGADVHRRARGRIVDRVGARAAIEHVRPGAADQRVIAVAARQRVVARTANQRIVAVRAIEIGCGGAGDHRVGAGRADEFLDVEKDIALRVAARRHARGKIDRHRRG